MTTTDPQMDDEYDARNDQTFGGEEDEWEWGESGELAPSPNQLSLDQSSGPSAGSMPMHSSDLMTSMTSIPNVSGIRRLSEIEQSFSSIGLQDDSGPPDDPAIMKYTKSSDQSLSLMSSSDPFSSFSMPHPSRLSSSVWAPPDQSLFDTTSVPQSLSSDSPVPPAPPSDPWNSTPAQSAHNLNNNCPTGSKTVTPSHRPAPGIQKVIQQPMRLEELEASFLSESSPVQLQVPQMSLNHSISPQLAGNRPVGQPVVRAEGQELLERQMRAAEKNRMSMPMMAMPVHMPFAMPHRPLVPGRINMVQHPLIQQNFLMMQQAAYRPPGHTYPNQPQMRMQMHQQQFPYHRVNYANSSPNTRPPLEPRRPVDEYAGFMSQKEREWLVKIQKLQLESSITDPYVEDYYAMCYNSKKLVEAKTRESQTAPTLVVVEPRVARGPASSSSRDPKSDGDITHTTTGSNYVPFQFENSLGKIQVSNIQCPRKLLDLISVNERKSKTETSDSKAAQLKDSDQAKPLARKELTKFRKLLLEIERLYLILLKIDYEDKRMAALPPDQRQTHLQIREDLCRELFDGITQQSKDKNEVRLNLQITSIRKGCALIFRALQLLHDVRHKEVIITDLLDEENFHLIANQKDKELYSLDYLKILFDAMKSINPGLTDEELTRVSI